MGKKIGFIGLGNMGNPMAKNRLAALMKTLGKDLPVTIGPVSKIANQ